MSATPEDRVTLLAPQEFRLPPDGLLLPGLAGGAAMRQELDTVYFDSRDLALTRAGGTLCFRRDGPRAEWLIDLPGGGRAAPIDIGLDGDGSVVPAEARDLVRGYLRGRRLAPIARLRTTRTRVPLLDQDGRPVVDLVDDAVAIVSGSREVGSLRQVELELRDGNGRRRARDAAVERLVAAGCRAVPPRPALLRALGDRATAPADVVVPVLPADPTVYELTRRALATSVDRLLRHDPGVRLGRDPEDVHQCRVAARTLRSNLKTFAAVLDPAWARRVRDELKWLIGVAGRVRDLDVLELRLRARIADLPEVDAEHARVLFDRIHTDHARARRALLAALRSRRYDALLNDLVAAAANPPLAAEAQPAAPARRLVRRGARKQLRRLQRVAAASGTPPSDAELHAIRIQTKRTRYAVEAARPVIGPPAVRHAEALAGLQDVLGDFHDAVVAEQWLRETFALDPSSGLVVGQLVAAERCEQRRLRGLVEPAWRTAHAKKLTHWL